MKNDINVIFRNLETINFQTLQEAHAEISKRFKCDLRDLYYSNHINITMKGTRVWIAGKNLKNPAAFIFV